MRADACAKARLRGLFPALSPWTAAALWQGCGPAAPPPSTPIADELDDIVGQRLAGLLLRYLRTSGASIDPRSRAVLQEAEFEWASATTQVVAAGAQALLTLREAGIDGVVSKGPGIAAAYPGPECRPYSDLDVVVAPGNFTRGIRILQTLGWAEEVRNEQPWAYFERTCREGVNLRNDAHGRFGSVDVHHRFPPWIWSAGLSPAAVTARAAAVVAAGETIPCLSPADNLVVAALHVVSDRNAPGRSLLVWRDIVQLAAAVPVPEAVRAARESGLAGWVRAILLALPDEVRPHELCAALPDDPLPHPRRLAYLLSPATGRAGVLASQFLRLPLPNGLAFVAGMLVPSRRFLSRKYPQGGHVYRLWWSRVRRSRFS